MVYAPLNRIFIPTPLRIYHTLDLKILKTSIVSEQAIILIPDIRSFTDFTSNRPGYLCNWDPEKFFPDFLPGRKRIVFFIIDVKNKSIVIAQLLINRQMYLTKLDLTNNGVIVVLNTVSTIFYIFLINLQSVHQE